jgi:hypothetical protein
VSIYDKKELEKLFIVDHTSPSGLVWKENRWGGKFKQILKAKAGDMAGSKLFKIDGTPIAWHVNYNGGKLLAHRVVWVLYYGYIEPELIIDHLDGDPFNNTVSNLRKTTIRINNRNQRLPKNNSTGVIGVGFTKDKYGVINGYRVHWSDITGKDRTKRFSFCKYPDELSAFKAAKAFRLKIIEEMNLEGAGYSDRHGSHAVENLT